MYKKSIFKLSHTLMPSKALLKQAKHYLLRFWIETGIVCGTTPPHHLTSKRRGKLAVKKSVVYGICFIAIQAVTFTFNFKSFQFLFGHYNSVKKFKFKFS